ncbi:protein kinase [Kitasatospora sp. NBC_00240]|uniref:serine/threonine protein kinase n=1 Tax=Kitasatospora sp. NBC_00240 TaxID=2903567 RepID=UPI00224DBB57|nr:protein kinase [Kitasatospora sp. NBC_00240]MCX5208762.1 protein kinase [Kitasatospora sp. NBC_00240]
MTRRDDDGSAGERLDAAVTRRDGGGGPAALLRLPSALAGRFVVVGELPHQGREADVLLVRDAAGVEFVAKVYRSGIRVMPEVWERLRGLDTSHVVEVVETGFSDGRDFEVSEYLASGSLESLVGAVVSPAVLSEVVSQLTEAVAHLHEAGIVHGDLKPSNVLVRRRDPLELALADFGVSKSLDATSRFTQRVFGTLAYSAPEYLFSAEVSGSQDWWAVGVIARQLATGRAPFEGLSEQAVRHHLATRPVDVSEVTDPRVRLLCRGLLVRDPGRRWGAAEVRSWLDGGAPEVAEDLPVPDIGPPRAAGRRPLQFNGVKYTGKAALARALAANWETAARRFFEAMGERDDPSQGWRQLRTWLAQFDDPEHDAAEELVDLIDIHLPGTDAPDTKLLRLLHWLDPTLPPVYRGRRMLPEDLLALAELASSPRDDEGRRTARGLVDELYTGDLLTVLATFGEGAHRLAGVNHRWRDLNARWDGLQESSALPPRIRQELVGTEIRVEALAIAVAPEWARALRQRIESSATSVQGSIGWFDALLADGGDPVRHLAATRTLSTAVAEARRLAEVLRATEAATATQRREWQETEERRQSGTGEAILTALGGIALLFALPVGVPLVVGTLVGEGEFLQRFLPASSVLCGVPLVCELVLAARLGQLYHPRWSLLSRLADIGHRLPGGRRALATQLRPMRKRTIALGGGCLLHVALGPLVWLIVTLRVWSPIPLAVAAGYGFWSFTRYRVWRSTHEAQQTQVLGER